MKKRSNAATAQGFAVKHRGSEPTARAVWGVRGWGKVGEVAKFEKQAKFKKKSLKRG
jgi:hypothetical protein